MSINTQFLIKKLLDLELYIISQS